jgi:aliphatic nitrilase
MGDTYKKLRLAAVQAAPVFLDRDASVEKACRFIREAGDHHADVIGFPEGFIPTHPNWCNYLPPSGTKSLRLSRELFKNSVEVPSPATDRLGQACRDASVVAVIGMCEKRPDTTGTMWNIQLFIDRTGDIIGKHQKLVPTHGERLVHTPGADMMAPVRTHFGGLSGLMCGENSNPLAAFALSLGYPVVHVASWPAHFGQTHHMQDSILASTRGLAYQLKAFCINACSIVTDEMIETYALTDEDRAILHKFKETGAASIIGPRGQILAGPMGPGEGILYCDVDCEDVLIPKLMHDFAGHYNRPDLFQVAIADGRYAQAHFARTPAIEALANGSAAFRQTRPAVTYANRQVRPETSSDPEVYAPE